MDAVFATHNATWHLVSNIERRWRQIRQDTGFGWVTPHTFRMTVAALISERVDSETASQQLGHSSAAITKEFYISKPAIAATSRTYSRSSREVSKGRPIRTRVESRTRLSDASQTSRPIILDA